MQYIKEDEFIAKCLFNSEIGLKIDENLDWDYIAQKSKEDKTSSFLYKSLKTSEKNNLFLPKKFKEDYYKTSAINTLLFKEFKNILNCFSINNILTIVLKSAFSLENIYQDIGLKEISDIDILVKKCDICKIDTFLKQLGFIPYRDWSKYLDIPKSKYINSIVYVKGQGKIPVVLDIHWHLVNTTFRAYGYGENIDIDKIWKEARRAIVAGEKTLSLSPHHNLMYLCEHILSHSYQDFIHFYDIYKIIEYYGKDDINWQKLISDSKEFGLKLTVYYGLYFSSKFTHAKVPDFCLKALAPIKCGYAQRRIEKFIESRRKAWLLRHFFYFFICADFKAKIKYVSCSIFPPKEMIAYRYGLEYQKIKPYHYLLQFKKILKRIFVKN